MPVSPLIYENENILSDELCNLIEKLSRSAIAERNSFTVGLSGGSLAKFVCSGLPSREIDWPKWTLFFCDERHVPFDNDDCTFKYYSENLIGKVPLRESQFVKNDPNASVESAADEYQKEMLTHFPGQSVPRFDLLLLGMGPDGHTCSLFPGHPLLEEKTRLVAPISDSPKPPSQRITFTYPLIQNARNVVFASCGASKAQIIKRVLEDREDPLLPAARVFPTDGQLYWLLDKAAASLLANKDT